MLPRLSGAVCALVLAVACLTPHRPPVTPQPQPPVEPPVVVVPPTPGPAPELPIPPMTRAGILAMRCDLAYTEREGENSEWQSYKYAGWSDAKRAEARALWKRIGMTHVPLNFSIRYQEAEFDFRNTPDTFTDRLKELRRDGFYPLLNVYAPETYGPQAETEPLASDLRRLLPMWREYLAGAYPGFEVGDRGDGSGVMLVEISRLLRELLGPEKLVGLAFMTPPGREPITYDGRIASSPQDYFRHIGRGVVDGLFIEIGRDRFDDRNRKHFLDDLYGLNPRFSSVRNPDFPRWPWGEAFSAEDEPMRANWYGPDYGLGMHVYYFEGPAFSRWSSAEKNEWGGWAMEAPGIMGYCDGGRAER